MFYWTLELLFVELFCSPFYRFVILTEFLVLFAIITELLYSVKFGCFVSVEIKVNNIILNSIGSKIFIMFCEYMTRLTSYYFHWLDFWRTCPVFWKLLQFDIELIESIELLNCLFYLCLRFCHDINRFFLISVLVMLDKSISLSYSPIKM